MYRADVLSLNSCKLFSAFRASPRKSAQVRASLAIPPGATIKIESYLGEHTRKQECTAHDA